ncbi:MAG: hypothetical protein M3Q10_19230 [Chloroflexota bacterium]|nr:hypothetical protein [Chloroflexota bacterium]
MAFEVRSTIEAADRIVRDANYPDRENHYRRISRPGFLKVVAYDAVGSGIVITAHRTHGVKTREVHLWP